MCSLQMLSPRACFSPSVAEGVEAMREKERERRKSGWLWVEQATDGRVEKFVIWRDSEGEGLRDNKANEKQT